MTKIYQKITRRINSEPIKKFSELHKALRDSKIPGLCFFKKTKEGYYIYCTQKTEVKNET